MLGNYCGTEPGSRPSRCGSASRPLVDRLQHFPLHDEMGWLVESVEVDGIRVRRVLEADPETGGHASPTARSSTALQNSRTPTWRMR
jgi:hypothetical protein